MKSESFLRPRCSVGLPRPPRGRSFAGALAGALAGSLLAALVGALAGPAAAGPPSPRGGFDGSEAARFEAPWATRSASLAGADSVLGADVAAGVGTTALSAPTVRTQLGDRPLLVILVKFDPLSADANEPPTWPATNYPLTAAGTSDNAHALWWDYAFGPRPSIASYYEDASGDLFHVVPAVEVPSLGRSAVVTDGIVDWVKLDAPWDRHPNDPSRAPPLDFDAWSQAFPIAVIRHVGDKGLFDFAPFDTNGDGAVSSSELLILIVVSGYDESFSSTTQRPAVWPFCFAAWTVHALTPSGVYVATYFGETDARTGSYSIIAECQAVRDDEGVEGVDWLYVGTAADQSTIGQACHELGHELLLPDAYDTTPDGAPDSKGVGRFDLMGYGSWNEVLAAGDCPARLSAWERYRFGWTAVTELTEPADSGSVTLAAADASGLGHQTLLLRSSVLAADEFFLVENRRFTGYDEGLPGGPHGATPAGSGLLIWHVDESQRTNDVRTHYFLDVEEASGYQDLPVLPSTNDNYGDGDDYWRAGDLGPSTFDVATTPNSKSYAGADTGISVQALGPSSDVMSVYATVDPPAPVVVAGGGGGGGCMVGAGTAAGGAAPGATFLNLLAPLAVAVRRRRRRSRH